MHRTIWMFILSSCTLVSCNRMKKADLILTNAIVYSVDSTFGIYQSVAVDQGRIVDVGSDDDISGHYTSDHIMDLQGKYVYPGFIDAHCHFDMYGLGLQEAELTGTVSFADVVDRVRAHAEKKPSGWIVGRGWDQNDWEDKSFPDRAELDKFFPDRPVVLFRIDGHAALANATALKLAGIDASTAVSGGEVVKKNGRLTGILVDNAVDILRRSMPEPGKAEMETALLDAQQNCFGVGLTSVQNAGLNADVIGIMDELDRKDSLKIRIYAMILANEKNFEAYMYKGIYKTDRLHVCSVKLFADGALGSRGARLLEPYSDDPGNRGLFVTDPDYIRKVAHPGRLLRLPGEHPLYR